MNFFVRVDPLQTGDAVGAGLPSSVFGPRQDVGPCESDGDGSLLDGARPLPSFLKDPHQELPLYTKVLELVSFCIRHVSGSYSVVFWRGL